MLIGGVVLTAAGVIAGEASALDLGGISSASAWGLLYLIGPGPVVAFTAYAWLLAHAPVSQVSTYAYVNPVIAVFLGWFILAGPLTGPTLVGAALTVLAVVVIVTTSKPRKGENHA